MRYNTSDKVEAKKAEVYLKSLIEKGYEVEVKRILKKRTIRQNSYLHAIFNLFAINFGYTFKEVKQSVFKKIVNPETFKIEFVDKLTGEVLTEWRSTADLNTKELTLCIDRFRNYSSANGYYIEDAEEYIMRYNEINRYIEQHKEYL